MNEEHYGVFRPRMLPALFWSQISDVYMQHLKYMVLHGLDESNVVFKKIFLSDIHNQEQQVRDSALCGENECVSLVGQPPLSGAKIEMLVYHIRGKIKKEQICGGVAINGRHEWRNGGKFSHICGRNVVRAWLYISDIAHNYARMNNLRNEAYEERGITEHYFASTGIGAQNDLTCNYNIVGLNSAQVEYLQADGLMPAPKSYGVMFERGIKISYRDRAHLFISGTASIGLDGKVLYEKDVISQTERALRNLSGVLRSGGAELRDLAYIIVYVRDAADYMDVKNVVEGMCPSVRAAYVQAEICRPEWMVEIEGVACVAQDEPSMPSFL